MIAPSVSLPQMTGEEDYYPPTSLFPGEALLYALPPPPSFEPVGVNPAYRRLAYLRQLAAEEEARLLAIGRARYALPLPAAAPSTSSYSLPPPRTHSISGTEGLSLWTDTPYDYRPSLPHAAAAKGNTGSYVPNFGNAYTAWELFNDPLPLSGPTSVGSSSREGSRAPSRRGSIGTFGLPMMQEGGGAIATANGEELRGREESESFISSSISTYSTASMYGYDPDLDVLSAPLPLPLDLPRLPISSPQPIASSSSISKPRGGKGKSVKTPPSGTSRRRVPKSEEYEEEEFTGQMEAGGSSRGGEPFDGEDKRKRNTAASGPSLPHFPPAH